MSREGRQSTRAASGNPSHHAYPCIETRYGASHVRVINNLSACDYVTTPPTAKSWLFDIKVLSHDATSNCLAPPLRALYRALHTIRQGPDSVAVWAGDIWGSPHYAIAADGGEESLGVLHEALATVPGFVKDTLLSPNNVGGLGLRNGVLSGWLLYYKEGGEYGCLEPDPVLGSEQYALSLWPIPERGRRPRITWTTPEAASSPTPAENALWLQLLHCCPAECGRALLALLPTSNSDMPLPRPEATSRTDEVRPSISVFDDDDSSYLRWIAAHPGGFVLNTNRTPKSGYLVLHRPSCTTISRYAKEHLAGGFTERQYIKVCSSSETALLSWAQGTLQSTAISFLRCAKCRP